VYYAGPFFRYERPQKGRQRQFHQFGCELLGASSSEADIEILALAHDFLESLGIKSRELHINTLATPEIRQQFKQELISYFSSHLSELSEDSQSRLQSNPLRILDSKNPGDKALSANAPKMQDMLDAESNDHFEKVLSLLDALSIPYTVNPLLVRGLDYYSHTVFEFTSTALGAQDALGGGGRYDHLFEHFGGKHTPSIGFAFGMERLLLAMTAQESIPEVLNPEIYVIGFESDASRNAVISCAHALRIKSGKKVIVDVQNRSLKAQMKEADKLGIGHVIIIGPDEVLKHNCIVKDLSSGMQYTKSIDELDAFFG
jgi:histidyl-tRNA synthetase